MLSALRFLWQVSRGHRLRPWRSPLLRWRLETYSGKQAGAIGAGVFLKFVWHERRNLLRFLRWTGQMERYRRLSRHPAQSGAAGPDEGR